MEISTSILSPDGVNDPTVDFTIPIYLLWISGVGTNHRTGSPKTGQIYHSEPTNWEDGLLSFVQYLMETPVIEF